jgi:hypothetical protein
MFRKAIVSSGALAKNISTSSASSALASSASSASNFSKKYDVRVIVDSSHRMEQAFLMLNDQKALNTAWGDNSRPADSLKICIDASMLKNDPELLDNLFNAIKNKRAPFLSSVKATLLTQKTEGLSYEPFEVINLRGGSEIEKTERVVGRNDPRNYMFERYSYCSTTLYRKEFPALKAENKNTESQSEKMDEECQPGAPSPRM